MQQSEKNSLSSNWKATHCQIYLDHNLVLVLSLSLLDEVLGDRLENTFYYKKKTGEENNGHNLYYNGEKNYDYIFFLKVKNYCGHYLLLLRMIIYSTPVLGAPVISLPEKEDFKVGFEENGK